MTGVYLVWYNSDMSSTEAHKRAQRRYSEKNKGKYKTISITQTAEQTEADRVVLAEHGTTVLRVWRAAMERLRNEPIDGSTPED